MYTLPPNYLLLVRDPEIIASLVMPHGYRLFMALIESENPPDLRR